MQFPDEISKKTNHRLSRLNGQIAAIEKMIDNKQDCKQILIQLSAANNALQAATVHLFTAALKYCALNANSMDHDKDYDFEDIEKLFAKMI
jgi:DNA-binding FrmR family transcriptional regulator